MKYFQANAVLLMGLCGALALCGCETPVECDGKLKWTFSDPDTHKEGYSECSSACSDCGYGGGPASCVETDDWAYCDCGGQSVTICEDTAVGDMECGRQTCP